MGRLIAVGDIHGMLHKLTGIIDQISPEKDDTIVFLGDYIDCGYESYEVVEYLIKLKGEFPNIITLRGNHEDFVISMFSGNQDPRERDLWLNDNGGRLTKASYSRAGCYMNAHQEFYETLPHSYETDDYFFCHAGVRPGVPLNRQRGSDLLSIREPFLSSSTNYGKLVVHGHTMVDRPEILENRINLDTGAGKHGPLTAMELPSRKIWQQV